jgi:hypothetical protein
MSLSLYPDIDGIRYIGGFTMTKCYSFECNEEALYMVEVMNLKSKQSITPAFLCTKHYQWMTNDLNLEYPEEKE